MIKPIFILLNGPPGAGKDLGAAIIAANLIPAEKLAVKAEKFANPIKGILYAAEQEMFSLSSHGLFRELDSSRETKAQPRQEYFGKSCREVQIAISEQFMKPVFGEDIFGHLMVRRLEDAVIGIDGRTPVVVISDSGFEAEAKVLMAHYGADRLLLVKLSREGCNFTGDSRGYIDLEKYGVTSVEVVNNSQDIFEYEKDLLLVVKDFINTKMQENI